MLLTQQSIYLPLPPAQAFDIVCRLENFSQWFPGIIRVTPEDNRPNFQIGKRYRETIKVPIKGEMDIILTVVTSIPGQRFATQAELPILAPKMEMLFEPQGQGTGLTWRMHSEQRHHWLGWLLANSAGKIIGRRANIGLQTLAAQYRQTLTE